MTGDLFPPTRRRRHYSGGVANRLFFPGNNSNNNEHQQQNSNDGKSNIPLRSGVRRDRLGQHVGQYPKDQWANNSNMNTPPREYSFRLNSYLSSPQTTHSKRSTNTSRTDPDTSFESGTLSPGRVVVENNEPGEGHFAGDDAWMIAHRRAEEQQEDLRQEQDQRRPITPKMRRVGLKKVVANNNNDVQMMNSRRPLAASIDRDDSVGRHTMFPATSPKRSPPKRDFAVEMSEPGPIIPHARMVDDDEPKNKQHQQKQPPMSRNSPIGPLEFRVSPKKNTKRPSPSRPRGPQAVALRPSALEQGIGLFLSPMKNLVQCNEPDYTSVAEYSLTEPVPLEKTNSTISGASTEVATNRATDQAKKRIQALEDQFMSQKIMQIQERESLRQSKVIQRKMNEIDNESLPTDEEIDIKQSLRRLRHHTMAKQQMGEKAQEDEKPKAATLVVHKPPPVRNHRYSFGATKIPAKMMEQESILSMSEDESSRMTQSTAHSQQAMLSSTIAANKNVPIPTTIQPKRKKKRQVDLVPTADQQHNPSQLSSLPDQSHSSSLGVEIDGSRTSIRNGVNSIMTGLPKEPLQPLIEQQESPRSMPRTPPRKKDDGQAGLLMPELSSGSKEFLVPVNGTASSATDDGDIEDSVTLNTVETPENTGRASPRVTQTRHVTGGSYLSPPRTSGRIPKVGEFSPDPVFCSKSVTSADMHSYHTQSPSASTIDRNFSMSFDSSIRSKMSQSLEAVPEDGAAVVQSPLSRVAGRLFRSPKRPPSLKESVENPEEALSGGISRQASTKENPGQPAQVDKTPPPPPPPRPVGRPNDPFQFLPSPNSIPKWQRPSPQEQHVSKKANEDKAGESLYKSTPAWTVMNQLKKDREFIANGRQSRVNRTPKPRNMQGSLEAENPKPKSSVMKAISIFEKQLSGGNESQARNADLPVARSVQSRSAPRPHDDIFDDLDTGDEASVSVKSLLSAFETAAPSTKNMPGDFEDDDDDTASVKSLRDRFEGPAEVEETEVSKKKALFEVRQKPSKPFDSSTNELQDVFSKFQAKISSRGQKTQPKKASALNHSGKPPESQIELIAPDVKMESSKPDVHVSSISSARETQKPGPDSKNIVKDAKQSNQTAVAEVQKNEPVRVSVADRAKMFGSMGRQKSNSGPLASKAISNAPFRFGNGSGNGGLSNAGGTSNTQWVNQSEGFVSKSMNQNQLPQPQGTELKAPFPVPLRGTNTGTGKGLEITKSSLKSTGLAQWNSRQIGHSIQQTTMPENSFIAENQSFNQNRLALAGKSSKSPTGPSVGNRSQSVTMIANSFNKGFMPQQVKASQIHEPTRISSQPLVRHGVVLRPITNRTLRCSTSSLQTSHIIHTSAANSASPTRAATSYTITPSPKDTPLMSTQQLPIVTTPQNSLNMPNYARPSIFEANTRPSSYGKSEGVVTGFQEEPSPESVPTANPLIVSEPEMPDEDGNVVLLRNSVSVGKPMKVSNQGSEVKHSPQSGGSMNGSDYSDGVTLDMSIAEVSGLTMPTALSAKHHDGSITLSPFSNSDSTATSLKSMSSKVDRVPLMERKVKASDESTVGDSINGVGEPSRKSESSAFADYVPLIEHEVKASDDVTSVEYGRGADEREVKEVPLVGREQAISDDAKQKLTLETLNNRPASNETDSSSLGESFFRARVRAAEFGDEVNQASAPEEFEAIDVRNAKGSKSLIAGDDSSSQGESFFGSRALVVAEHEGIESSSETVSLKDDAACSESDNDSASTGLWNPVKIEQSFPPRKSVSPEIFKFDSEWGSFTSNSTFTPIQNDQKEENQAFAEAASTPPRPMAYQDISVPDAKASTTQITDHELPRSTVTTPTRSIPRANVLPEARTPTNQIRRSTGASKSPARTPREDTPVLDVLSPSSSVKTPVTRTPRAGNLSAEAKTPTTSNRARTGFSQSVPQFRPMPIRTNLGSFAPYSNEERRAPKTSSAASLYSRHQAASNQQPAIPSKQAVNTDADGGPQFLVTRSTVTGDPRMMISPVRTPERQSATTLETQTGETLPPSIPVEQDAYATTGLAPRVSALSPARSPSSHEIPEQASIPTIPSHNRVMELSRATTNLGLVDAQPSRQENNHTVVASPSPTSSPTSFYHNSSAMAARLKSIKAARLRRAAQRYHQAYR